MSLTLSSLIKKTFDGGSLGGSEASGFRWVGLGGGSPLALSFEPQAGSLVIFQRRR